MIVVVECFVGESGDGWKGAKLAALCVGVSAYSERSALRKLGNAGRDAESMFKKMKDCSHCCAAIMRDPKDRITILHHLCRDFLDQLAALPEEEMPEAVMLILAGHGKQDGQDVFLIPSDAKSDTREALETECLSHLTVLEEFNKYNVLKDIKFWLILDVCRETDASSLSHTIDAKEGRAPKHYCICYSTSRGGVAEDGDPESHSPLVLGLLDDTNGILARGVSLKKGVELACDYVSRNNSRQTPIITGTGGTMGDLVLRPGIVFHEVGLRSMDSTQFTRRDAFMTRLTTWAASCEGSPRIAVVGQGGAGKSTLALCFLKELGRLSHDWARLVFFLQAGDLMRGYRDLFQKIYHMLGLKGPEPEKDEELRTRVHSLLDHSDIKNTWVGVLDDLPCPSDLQHHGMEWLLANDARGFPWGSGKAIVTSRSQEWVRAFGSSHLVEMVMFEVHEAVAFLKGKVEGWREDNEGVVEVARRLGYFPLKLASAAGCASEYDLDTRSYMQELEKSCSKYVQKWESRNKGEGEYMYSYTDVVRMTWERLALGGEDADRAKELLRKLAMMDPCSIPVDLFEDSRLLMSILKSHCLVTLEMGPPTLVSMHALLQQEIRDHFMGDDRPQVLSAVVAVLVREMHTFDSDKPETYKTCTCRAYVAHVKAVLDHADASEDVAALAVHTGWFLEKVTCAYVDARQLFEQALKMRIELAKGEDSSSVVMCYFKIGSVLDSQSEYDQALESYQKALEMTVRVVGHDHLDVAKTRENMAIIYEQQGQYDQALEIYESVLEVKIRVFGHEHPDVAATYYNIANVYDSQGKYDEALDLYQKAEKVLVGVHGHEHPDVTKSLCGIAIVYENQGKYNEALELYHKAEQVFVTVYGHDHPDVATTKENIGLVFRKIDRKQEAKEMFKQAADIRRKVFGPAHALTKKSESLASE